uniref:Uncharacterized protein n=1 Tax=Parascaris equorum TaxID=6256 RepID=A0A914S207_PAREQ
MEREEAENRKRDEEAIRKWEMEEAERLEAAAKEEEAERIAVAEAERKRLEREAEQKRQEEIDDFLERLSPLDFVDESADVGDRKEESFGVDSQQQPQQSFANMEQPMSHESLHNPSTPSSCGYAAVVEV